MTVSHFTLTFLFTRAVSRQKRAHAGLDDLWTDWPTLGKGWKRREVYRNCGTRTDTYYMRYRHAVV